MPPSFIPSPCPSHTIYCASAANDIICVFGSLVCVLGALHMLLALFKPDASGFFHGQALFLNYYFFLSLWFQLKSLLPQEDLS